MIISVDESIYKYLIELLYVLLPSGVEYCHLELPSVSSKETVLNPLYHENAYKNNYDLPNTNPRCPQLVVPSVFLIQTSALENVRGSNLNKCCPVQKLPTL
jgi:hypothetical protein